MPEVEIKTEPLFNEVTIEEDVHSMNSMDHHHMMQSTHHNHTSQVFLSEAAPVSQQVEIQVQLEGKCQVVK